MQPTLKVFEPTGLLDATASESIRLAIADNLKAGAEVILIDLAAVSFVDSSGLGSLVRALKLVRTEGKRLCLSSLSDQAKLLFEITCMDRTFEIFSDRHACEASLQLHQAKHS